MIGVTGQIGSGKTTTAGIIAEYLDALLLEVDRIGQELYSLEETRKFFSDHFGASIFNHGIVDRKRLAETVFESREKLDQLNSYFDHTIFRYLENAIAETEKKYILIDAAILLQTSWANLTDLVIVVNAPERMKVKRASKKLNIAEAAVELRRDQQLSEQELLKSADYTVDNKGTFKDLDASCLEIASKIRSSIG